MRARVLVGVAAVCLFAAAGGADDKAVRKDREALQGSWVAVSYESGDVKPPEEFLKKITVVVKDDGWEVHFDADVIKGTHTLDPSKKPKQFDGKITEGSGAGETIRGIYEIDGESFRMCRGLQPENQRPEQFAAPADSGRLLVVWKRAPGGGAVKDKEAAFAIQAELGRFEGSWRFDAVEFEGKEMPLDGFKGIRLVLKGDRFTMVEPAATYGGNYVVDPTARPKTIDVTFTDGPEKGNSCYGIYELDGDTYKVCIGLTGKPRPTEFASTPGSGHVLEVLKREKP